MEANVDILTVGVEKGVGAAVRVSEAEPDSVSAGVSDAALDKAAEFEGLPVIRDDGDHVGDSRALRDTLAGAVAAADDEGLPLELRTAGAVATFVIFVVGEMDVEGDAVLVGVEEGDTRGEKEREGDPDCVGLVLPLLEPLGDREGLREEEGENVGNGDTLELRDTTGDLDCVTDARGERELESPAEPLKDPDDEPLFLLSVPLLHPLAEALGVTERVAEEEGEGRLLGGGEKLRVGDQVTDVLPLPVPNPALLRVGEPELGAETVELALSVRLTELQAVLHPLAPNEREEEPLTLLLAEAEGEPEGENEDAGEAVPPRTAVPVTVVEAKRVAAAERDTVTRADTEEEVVMESEAEGDSVAVPQGEGVTANGDSVAMRLEEGENCPVFEAFEVDDGKLPEALIGGVRDSVAMAPTVKVFEGSALLEKEGEADSVPLGGAEKEGDIGADSDTDTWLDAETEFVGEVEALSRADRETVKSGEAVVLCFADRVEEEERDGEPEIAPLCDPVTLTFPVQDTEGLPLGLLEVLGEALGLGLLVPVGVKKPEREVEGLCVTARLAT